MDGIVPLRLSSLVDANLHALAPASSSWDFAIEIQEKTNWCWAAVAASLASFYHLQPWSQCRVACRLLGSGCCDGGNSCNDIESLEQALGPSGVNVLASASSGTLDFETVVSEIAARKLVAICLRLSQMGQTFDHFVVIANYDTASRTVHLADPSGDLVPVLISFDELSNGTAGLWVASYLTTGS